MSNDDVSLVGVPDGAGPPTALGLERADACGTARAGARVELSDSLVTLVRSAADAAGVPVDVLVAGVWGLLLAEYSGESEVLFGAIAEEGRVLPLRIRIEPDERLRTYLRRLWTVRDEAADNLWPTPPHAADRLRPAQPPFDVLLAVASENDSGPDSPLEGQGRALLLTVMLNQKFRIEADFAPNRYGADAIDRLLSHFSGLLGTVAADPHAPASTIGVFSAAELSTLVHTWNDTAQSDPPPPACIHELFEAQVRRAPDAVAVLDSTQGVLTYGELDEAADRLADSLAALGVRRGERVAVHLERTVDAAVALLGVLKAGAAYVPVEPTLPAARVRSLLLQLDASVVVSDLACLGPLLDLAPQLPALRDVVWLAGPTQAADPATRGRAAELGIGLHHGTEPRGARRRPAVTPTDVAYVLFTSGSTGTPKGVVMSHAPVVNLIRWVNDTFAVGPQDRVLLVTPLAFDLSVYSIFGLLACGGSVRIAADSEVRDPDRLLALLDDAGVTFWNSAPAVLQQVEELFATRPPAVDAKLRLAFLSGDWIPVGLPDSLRRAFPGTEVVALGGPTETAIWSNYHRVGAVDPSWASIPYGRPIRNVRLYVLDHRLRPVPVGVAGNLYAGGACLADGYFGDPVLTARKFVPDPFGSEPGARIYDTGDRVRYRPDGVLEFLGRADHQVKIRGHRIELAEVGAALGTLPQVLTAIADTDRAGDDARLVAYVVPAEGRRPDPQALREQLADLLPDYMLPELIVVVDQIPLTANGKMDRAALAMSRQLSATAVVPRPARTPLEETIAGVWAQVIGVEQVGVHAGFVQNGGHSLSATRAVARLRATLGVKIPLRTMLTAPTLSDFAASVERMMTEGAADGHSGS